MSNQQQEFLDESTGGDYEPMSFDRIGAGVAGVVLGTPRVLETQYGRRMIVDIKPDNGDPVTVWVKPGAMARAISKACKAAGVRGVAEGGRLHLAYVADGEAKAGLNPPKLYEARYTPPAGGISPDDIFGTGGAA